MKKWFIFYIHVKNINEWLYNAIQKNWKIIFNVLKYIFKKEKKSQR